MTLRDLVEKYDGEVTFAVSKLITGGVEDVVEFSCADCAAIKDEIMDSSVSKYSITTSTARVTAISVVLEEISEAPSEDSETTESEGSSDSGETTDGETGNDGTAG